MEMFTDTSQEYLLKSLKRFSILRPELHSKIVEYCAKSNSLENVAEFIRNMLHSNKDKVASEYVKRRLAESQSHGNYFTNSVGQGCQEPKSPPSAEKDNKNHFQRRQNRSDNKMDGSKIQLTQGDNIANGKIERDDENRSSVSIDDEVANSVQALSLSEPSNNTSSGYDICKSRDVQKSGVTLSPSLFVQNREKIKIQDREGKCEISELMPGMVLMKNWLTKEEQVKIVLTCRELGVGPGGFYQPGYGDRSKLRLWMMCFGKHWDPETKTYQDIRPNDNAKPPLIPEDFLILVDKAIQEANDRLKSSKQPNAHKPLPHIHPDLCLVNFYKESGRLGFHQDKDESNSSIQKGLPIVSFSIGDSAEFLYNTIRDEENAKKVILESGDVLLFGGPSRLIFHGISRLLRHTAPYWLSSETKIRPGRLSLTFRQY
eukprot:TRINITY_DN10381_c0_g1_i1.p1 TRINITY_DN10381_c0_g1~~TRINITY_DN10381_c0_g1_i1.p1  ORF type:complete len:430 (-),score=65.13 TRINITY_DN10381_c0_g1_i1:41-1330(-)